MAHTIQTNSKINKLITQVSPLLGHTEHVTTQLRTVRSGNRSPDSMPHAPTVVLHDTYSLRTIFEEPCVSTLKLRCLSLRICLQHFENDHLRIQLIRPSLKILKHDFAHICIIFYQ